ncbi:MAG: hypothetical protein Q8Q95_04215 [bacterium]|nr:hypothetical protein [bacterium]
MEEQTNSKMTIGGIVLLLVGVVIGYYVGWTRAGGSAAADTKNKAEAVAEAAEKVAAEAANPFSNTESNPLKGVQTNPLENVKINPFAQ